MEDMFRQHGRKSSGLVRVLYDLLQGKRELVRVYSRALGQELCFINAERVNPDLVPGNCPVYTTRELAYILSLSGEEFQRFHYLKTRLVG